MERKKYGSDPCWNSVLAPLPPQHPIYFLERVRVTSVSPVGEQTSRTYATLVAVKLKQARKQHFFAGWWYLQLPLPMLCSNGWVCRLLSKSLHCPTLVKLGWVDFRVKHCLLGPAQLPFDLPRLIKSEQTSAYDHSSSNLSADHFFCGWWLGFCFPFCLCSTADL